MPNPTVPLTFNQQIVFPVQIKPENGVLHYPNLRWNENMQLVWECQSEPFRLHTIEAPGGLVYSNKVGRRHSPYHPKVDNLDPLAYEAIHTDITYPSLVASEVVVGSYDTAPVQCSPYQGSTKSFGGSQDVPGLSHIPLSPDLENQVVSRLNDRLDRQKSVTVNYAMTYLERRESIDMVTKRARQLSKTLSLLRKGKYKEAYYNLFGSEKEFRGKRSKDRAANLWLEWQYGWSPLLGDIGKAVEDFFKDPPPTLMRVTAKGTESSANVEVRNVSFDICKFGSLSFPAHYQIARAIELKYVSLYRCDMPKLVALSSAGIADPATTVWEAVPFSFVADWFVNVGDVIRDYSIAHGLDHLYTVKSVKQVVEYRTSNVPAERNHINYSLGRKISAKGYVRAEGRTVAFKRTISSVRPRLALRLNSDPISWRRALSALALANNLLRGLDHKSKDHPIKR